MNGYIDRKKNGKRERDIYREKKKDSQKERNSDKK